MRSASAEVAISGSEGTPRYIAGTARGVKLAGTPSEHAAFGEREVPAPPDHDVVGHGDVQQTARGHELRRDRTVGRAGRRISARMVVHQDDRRGALGDRLAEHLARMDERRIQDAARDGDIAIEAVLCVEDGHVEFLDGQVLEPRRVRGPYVAWRPERRAFVARFTAKAPAQFKRGVDRDGSRGTDT